MTLTLHRMVWRDADASDDVQGRRRGPSAAQGAGLALAQGLTLHWMVRRGGDADDDAWGRRRGLSAAQGAELAHAQGCLAPRAGGRNLALGAAVWG